MTTEQAIAEIKKLGGEVLVDAAGSVVRVTLRDPKVTDAGMEHLKDWTTLKWLMLDNTQVTDAGLIHLQQLTKLKYLNLQYTQITDAGLEHFKKLIKLKELILYDTQVTDEGAAELQEALPNCLILH